MSDNCLDVRREGTFGSSFHICLWLLGRSVLGYWLSSDSRSNVLEGRSCTGVLFFNTTDRGCFRPNINLVISLLHKIHQVSITLAMRPVRHHVTLSRISSPEQVPTSLFEGREFSKLVGKRRACARLHAPTRPNSKADESCSKKIQCHVSA